MFYALVRLMETISLDIFAFTVISRKFVRITKWENKVSRGYFILTISCAFLLIIILRRERKICMRKILNEDSDANLFRLTSNKYKTCGNLFKFMNLLYYYTATKCSIRTLIGLHNTCNEFLCIYCESFCLIYLFML